jgi:ParB family chromosome partitioning protein
LNGYRLEAALSGYIEQAETNKIRPSEHPTRSDIGQLDELIVSIMDKGLLEPIVVRPVGDGFEVVAGNRRLEACRKLKFNSIPCHIVELDDKEAYEVSLTENIQRRALNPIEEGRAFEKYTNDYGYGGVSELARRIGRSHSYVSRRIALLSLPDSIKEEIVCRRTSPTVANELLSLDEVNKAELSEFITEAKDMTRTEVRSLARHLNGKRQKGDQGSEELTSYYDVTELRGHMIDRTLAKCVASLKVHMRRFDDAMNSLDDRDDESWVVRETLMWQRRLMNSQVDDLLRLRKRFRSASHCSSYLTRAHPSSRDFRTYYGDG